MNTNKPKNNEVSVHQPHDKLVRRLLSNVATARDVLEAYLPDSVKALVDLSFLERQPDTFVDSQHRMKEITYYLKPVAKTVMTMFLSGY